MITACFPAIFLYSVIGICRVMILNVSQRDIFRGLEKVYYYFNGNTLCHFVNPFNNYRNAVLENPI